MKSLLAMDGRGGVDTVVARTEHHIRAGGSEVWVCPVGHRTPEPPQDVCEVLVSCYGEGRPYRMCWFPVWRLVA